LKLLDRVSDRALSFLTAVFFVLLGLDIAIIDAIPFVDEAVLATIASTLGASVLSRRKARKVAKKAAAAAGSDAGGEAGAPAP